jgi:RNA-binding protein
MRKLTGQERKHLRKIAQKYEPVVYIGKAGLTDNVVEAADDAFNAHELIKVRFIDKKDEKDPIAQELQERTNSQIVGRIGHVVIMFRQNEDEDKRKIELDKV